MASLFEYANWIRQLSREQFASKYAHPFLLRRQELESGEQSWSFNTQTLPASMLARVQAAGADGTPLPAELGKYEVMPVVKSLQNPWPDRISVGRARNNDIVIGDTSISKLHGHFRAQQDGSFCLEDVGSSNGTRVNGQAVASAQAAPIRAGDAIILGAVSLTFLDAGSLYDFVANILAGSA